MERINVLITNISNLSYRDGDDLPFTYIEEGTGASTKAFMTNEAPIELLINHLQKQGEKLDHIILIASEFVRKPIGKKLEDSFDQYFSGDDEYRFKSEDSHFTCLKKRIEKYTKENSYDCPSMEEKDAVKIADEPDDENVTAAIFEVVKKLQMIADEGNEVHVYIESNGGVRYVMMMLNTISQILEKNNSNIFVEKIFSMVMHKKPVMVKDSKSIYDSIQILPIADEFLTYGRTNSLKRYFIGRLQKRNDVVKADIESCISALSKTASDLQLCRTEAVLEDFYGDTNIQNVLHEFCKKYWNLGDSSVRIFSYVAELIMGQYDRVIYKNYSKQNDKAIYLPNIVEWCLEKDFIQQALTLCAEKLPEYLFKSGILKKSSDFDYFLEENESDYEPSYAFLVRFPAKNTWITNLCVYQAFEKYRAEFPKKFSSFDLDKTLKTLLKKDEWKKTGYSDEQKNATLRLTEVLSGINSDKYYDRLLKFINALETLMNTPGLTNADAESWIRNSGWFDVNSSTQYLNHKWKIEISNSKKVFLSEALRGVDSEEKTIDSLHRKNKRIAVILNTPGIRENIFRFEKEAYSWEEYRQILEDIQGFGSLEIARMEPLVKERILNRYNYWNYFELGSELFSSSVPLDVLKRLFYLYGLCKEERNFSNHANVEASRRDQALDDEKLKLLIRKLLEVSDEAYRLRNQSFFLEKDLNSYN